ncbi:MAG: D-alanyl-D-alanine carboxypeptidase/D-alanyl-D-alanine-endopeptidase [Cyanothece sp. SIO2G6]|nr:D-alanyl-D-alanine carboxypeptidase/D-alanyl-D-alanine-endopeptidase [Cyanothece sp. SIO2G6]
MVVKERRAVTARKVMARKGLGLTTTVSLITMMSGMGTRAIALCPAQLGDRITTITQQPAFERARWGILVQTLKPSPTAAPVTLYEQAATQYFVPASNVKLLTTAAALDYLGPSFRVHTSVYLEPALNSESQPDTLPDLRVIGQGDPSLTSTSLQTLAQQVSDTLVGIEQRPIMGINRLIVDDHYFQGSPVNSTWEWEDVQAGYGAPANSLIVNHNEMVVHLYPQAVGQPLRLAWANPVDGVGWQVVNRSTTVRTGSNWVWVGRDLGQPTLYIDGQLQVGANRDVSAIAIPDPTAHFGRQLRHALEQVGMTVATVEVVSDRPLSPPTQPAIASLPSPLLPRWLQWANQDSNNLATEALLRQLGAVAGIRPINAASGSTLADSIAQLRTVLESLGVDPAGYQLADGSGLSRRNWVSPTTLAQTLQAMAHHPSAALYRQSLAIAATTGTLRSRWQNTPVAGNLWGKSGGLTGVASLSGYLNPPNYDPLVFSIIVNYSPQSGRVNRQAIDDIVLAIARLQPCNENRS